MAAIPSWGWLFVGALITGTAWYVDMSLFFWLGLAFITFGVFKLVIGFMLGKKVTKQEKKQVHAAPQANKYYRCQCGNPVRSNDVFCSYCGRRLR